MQKIRYLSGIALVSFMLYFIFTNIHTTKKETSSSFVSEKVYDVNRGLRKMLVKNPVLTQEVDSLMESNPYLRKLKHKFVSDYLRHPQNRNTAMIEFLRLRQKQKQSNHTGNLPTK